MANRIDLGTSLVATAPSPATSGTSLTITAGQGVNFPAAPFWATAAPYGTLPTLANAEIVLVTAVSTDTFTITRAQKGTSGQSIAIGWSISNVITAEDVTPVGSILPYAGRTAPNGYLLCFGQTVSQSTYAALFQTISPNLGAVAITNASPAVVTLNGHGFITGDQLYFNGSGTINTGLSQNTNYFVVAINTNTFSLATTLANAQAGTKITTTGALSGTINCYAQPYGGASSTNFNVPDIRGNVLAGADAMGGTAASRLTLSTSQGTYGMLGASGGEQAHTDIANEMPSHSHPNGIIGGGADGLVNVGVAFGVTLTNTGNTGGGAAHNNVQPTAIVNYIIKT